MRSATGGWSKRGSSGRFAAGKALDVQPMSAGRDSAGSIQTHLAARVRKTQLRFADHPLRAGYLPSDAK